MNMDGWGTVGGKKAIYQQYITEQPVQFTGIKLFYHNDTIGSSDNNDHRSNLEAHCHRRFIFSINNYEFKQVIWLFMFIGSFIGSILPELWSSNIFSMSSIILTAVGGLLGIWIGYKIGQGF